MTGNLLRPPPDRPQLYHITHIDNLSSIVQDGGLLSDAAMIARGGPATAIGMGSIKARWLQLPVKCFPGDKVGDYVPFYFCPRSVMLYLLHKGNHPELAYQVGQAPILHLVADLYEALVNTVNCVGVMGRGIALQFKHAFPANFEAYAVACDRGEVQPGRMFVTETGLLTGPRYIINFPTKRHWRGKSRMEDIEAGLAALAQEIRQRGIRSVAIPPLGSSLGGLNWADVRPRIEAALSKLPDVDVLIFEPFEATRETTTFRAKDVPKMTPGRASLVGLIDRYLAALLDPFITLLEVHKLMYFLQEAGEPLRLRFVKGPYGPYAENLRHVLVAIEGHLIAGYADGGDVPYKQLALVPGAVQEATAFLQSHADTRERFNRVTQLVEGFETPFGLELLSTVHWVVAHDGVQSQPAVVQAVHDWAPGKWQFTDAQIELASARLQAEGWLQTAVPTAVP